MYSGGLNVPEYYEQVIAVEVGETNPRYSLGVRRVRMFEQRASGENREDGVRCGVEQLELESNSRRDEPGNKKQ